MLAGPYVCFGLSGFGVVEHGVELILPKMSFYGSPGFGASTVLLKLTGGTALSRGLVLIMVPLLVVMSSFQNLACRASKGVGVKMIGEGLFGEDPFFSP